MFFIHDDALKALQITHPDLVHGKDFMVFMGIEEDGTAASDAWIERWKADVPQPTIESLKAAVKGMDMSKLRMFAPTIPAKQPISEGLQTL
jgi:hypothetical protein